MKRLRRISLVIMLTLPVVLFGQHDEVIEVGKERSGWKDNVHLKLQYAGGIGFISPGIGIAHSRDRVDTDLFFGYAPKWLAGDDIVMLTFKNTYFPFKKELDKLDMTIYPLSAGILLNYTFGGQFRHFWSDKYPKGYYWWDSSVRWGFFLGGKVTKTLENSSIKKISAYYELGFNDLYFVSYIQNSGYLGLYDILNLALGLKFNF